MFFNHLPYLCSPMRKGFYIFLSLFLSTLIMYSGSGVNVYFYCCNDCRAEGISAVAEHKCCEIHHHHHFGELITHYDDHACGQCVNDFTDACGVERITVKWTQSSTKNINLQPVILDLDFSVFFLSGQIELVSIDDQTEFTGKSSQKPPNLSKDDYFSLLTKLII